MLGHKKIFCFFYFIIAALIANAQVVYIDSLQLIIKSNIENTEKVKAYKALTQALIAKDFDESKNTSIAGAVLAEKLNDFGSLSEFNKMIGMAFYFKGSYDSAAIYYYLALNILKKTNAPLIKAGILNELGKLYRKTKDLDRALQMYDEAFSIY